MELHIVIYRTSGDATWQPKSDGTFSTRQLAENYISCLKDQRWPFETGIVSGVVEQLLHQKRFMTDIHLKVEDVE